MSFKPQVPVDDRLCFVLTVAPGLDLDLGLYASAPFAQYFSLSLRYIGTNIYLSAEDCQYPARLPAKI